MPVIPEIELDNDRYLDIEERALIDPAIEMQRHFRGRKLDTVADCLEVIEFLEARGIQPIPTVDQENHSDRWKSAFIKILRYIKEAHPHSKAVYAILHIWDVRELDDINCHKNMTQFGDMIGCTKAAVDNVVRKAADKFRTPPRRDQRRPESRQKMVQSRIAQLQ